MDIVEVEESLDSLVLRMEASGFSRKEIIDVFWRRVTKVNPPEHIDNAGHELPLREVEPTPTKKRRRARHERDL